VIRARPCQQHRPALLDFVDRGEIAPSTGAALAHLNRCNRCTTELETTMLAITALRRIGAEAALVEPSPDAWPRLKARIERWRRVRWAVLSPTTGMAMSALLVALLVAPLRLGMAPRAVPSHLPERDSPALRAELRVEGNYIASTRLVSLPAFDTKVSAAVSLPRTYPDGIRPTRKEVSPAGPSGRPPEAI
jgi:hypothetical protein